MGSPNLFNPHLHNNTDMQLTNVQRLTDEHWMKVALTEAELAAERGEVPVGAVIVKDDVMVATGRNSTIGENDPTGHAEINALRAAAQVLGNYRLSDCTLYVTLEPCAMCTGAILNSRLGRLVFGAPEPKTGAVGSVINLLDIQQLNHHTTVCGGVLAQECASMLGRFFLKKRQENRCAIKFPLRDDALRTRENAFAEVSEFLSLPPSYINDLPTLAGLRMHYVDAGSQNKKSAWLCLHAFSRWSYVFHGLVESIPSSERVLIPDLIGFGRSDKPKKENFHQLAWHRDVLTELVGRLQLESLVLVTDGWESGLHLNLCEKLAPIVKGIVILSENATWPPFVESSPVNECPYLDNGHRAGSRAFARILKDLGKGNSKPVGFNEELFSRAKFFVVTTGERNDLAITNLMNPRVVKKSLSLDWRSVFFVVSEELRV